MNRHCFADLVRRHCHPSHLRISPQRLLEAATTVKSLFDLGFIGYRDVEICLSMAKPYQLLSGNFQTYHEMHHLEEL